MGTYMDNLDKKKLQIVAEMFHAFGHRNTENENNFCTDCQKKRRFVVDSL